MRKIVIDKDRVTQVLSRLEKNDVWSICKIPAGSTVIKAGLDDDGNMVIKWDQDEIIDSVDINATCTIEVGSADAI